MSWLAAVADVGTQAFCLHQPEDAVPAAALADLVKVCEKRNKPRFDNIMLKTKTVLINRMPACCAATAANMY